MSSQLHNSFRLVAIAVILSTSAFAGVPMEYDLSAGRVVQYEYRFREYFGPDLDQLEDSGRRMDFQLLIRFEAEGKVVIEASSLRLVPAPPEGWIGDLDFERFSKITCTITAVMDASGRLENVSEPKADAVVANGEPSALELKGIRSFIWPYLCRSVELALVRLPPIERGPGQSWRCEPRDWGCDLPKSDKLFPFELLQVVDVQDERKVRIIGGPVQDLPPVRAEPLPPQGIHGLPFSRRQYDVQLDFDVQEQSITHGQITKTYERNSGDIKMPPRPIYVAKQIHEVNVVR